MPNQTVLMVDGFPVTVVHDGQLGDDDRDALHVFIREMRHHAFELALHGIEITEVTCPTRI